MKTFLFLQILAVFLTIVGSWLHSLNVQDVRYEGDTKHWTYSHKKQKQANTILATALVLSTTGFLWLAYTF